MTRQTSTQAIDSTVAPEPESRDSRALGPDAITVPNVAATERQDKSGGTGTPEPPPEDSKQETREGGKAAVNLDARLDRLEKQNKWMRVAMVLLVVVTAYFGLDRVIPASVMVQKNMTDSQQVKLVDSAGNTRFFLRMYSRVPVLQLLDTSGKPRMSLGLRFDDTPFLDLSDKTGTTRATFEMTAEDEPTLRLFNADGTATFKIN